MESKHQQYNKYKRDPESYRFYRSTAWRKCRQLALMRDDYLCQHCYKHDQVITPADMVHHIKEYKDHRELGLVLDNLISLCNACHNKIHHGTQQRKPRGVNVITSKPNREMW
ncbi:prophage LambdaBa02, HNH endonuclease family protein [Fictibacillus macauensis ZFHKF-1]|uniref:Putative HNH nuclease YajD n=1 Tax=Fictibacillus macauensis ZFHKF-1 TaxID=1196324 RepID=I8UG95_9BACL|nr:HNH endonuclease signature motif containing protein [Fictibacillus macauensis]EIT85920.1 prophage LambdaBa02, HNH endonuclease family protein [Fictibacillus macauensis ZFHKF-1]